MSDEYKNIAKDRAHVGLQIGQMYGNANVDEAPAQTSRENLQVMIEELRRELRASRQRGSIDADSADAVEKELNEAADCLPASDDGSKSKFVVAMKKIKGLVEGLAGLTTKVARAIAAVHGLQ
jgi:adenosylhomocysteine nucleosidase